MGTNQENCSSWLFTIQTTNHEFFNKTSCYGLCDSGLLGAVKWPLCQIETPKWQWVFSWIPSPSPPTMAKIGFGMSELSPLKVGPLQESAFQKLAKEHFLGGGAAWEGSYNSDVPNPVFAKLWLTLPLTHSKSEDWIWDVQVLGHIQTSNANNSSAFCFILGRHVSPMCSKINHKKVILLKLLHGSFCAICTL